MILANLRQRLTAADHALVLQLLAGGHARRQRRLAERAAAEGPDVLLDDPELPALLEGLTGHTAPSAALFFYVAVRHTLRRRGLDDARLADYVGALVFEFGRRDRAWRIAPYDDDEFRYLTDILAAAEAGAGRRGFLLRAHLGNFSLWLAGLFPDHIAARQVRRGGPDLRYYEALGARGFRLASDDAHAAAFDLADVLGHAAERFAEIRVALNRLSDRRWFPGQSPDRLLRQAADAVDYPTPDPPPS